MFRSTPHLLFHPMPTLQRFKIHPPLPLNPRESKQLLNLLTTSFRQQLDAEHGPAFKPPPSSSPPSAPRTTSLNEHGSNSGSNRPRRPSETTRPTERHLQSILSNPLFSYVPHESGENSKQERDPMDIFDKAVARGMMDTNYARACLIAKKREILASSLLDVRQGMKTSGAGLKMLRWLVSSGTANNTEFLLKDETFAEVLMEFMVAEQLQEAAWSWIRKALDDAATYRALGRNERNDIGKSAITPLLKLVKAEAKRADSLDAAYMSLARAASYLEGWTVEEMRWVLSPPGNYLSRETTTMSSERQPASEASFDSFLGLMPAITIRSEYQIAYLYLLHPTKATAALALSYLRKLEKSASQNILWHQSSRHHNIIKLGLDTAKFLLEHDACEDAEWVMDFLRETFPKQLGLEKKMELEQVRAEAENLLLLEGLSLA